MTTLVYVHGTNGSGKSTLAIYRRGRVYEHDRYGYPNGNWSWSPWMVFESQKWLKPDADMEERLRFWRELNDYAVSQRGESARVEYKLEEA